MNLNGSNDYFKNIEYTQNMCYTFRCSTYFFNSEVQIFQLYNTLNTNKEEKSMKKQVHYGILEDMKRYIDDFNFDSYESTFGKTDPFVIEYVRNYYDNHLPVDVTAWARVNEPDEHLIYAQAGKNQICFVRDKLCELLYPSFDEWKDNQPMVISTHYSKSVRLPVYQINLKKYGIEIVLIGNFYDSWIISITSDKLLDFNYMGLFNPEEVFHVIPSDGFPMDKVYGSYSQNHSKFTIIINSCYDLYTLFFLLKNYLGIKRDS